MTNRNISIIIQSLKMGGAQKQCILLANALSGKYNVSLIVINGSNIEPQRLALLNNESVNLYPLKGHFLQKIINIIKIFKKNKIEIVISYLTSDNIWAVLVGKLLHIPILIGGIRNSKLPFLKSTVLKYFHNNIMKTTVLNNYRGVHLLEEDGFNKEKFTVINNCIINNNSLLIRDKKKQIDILTVGRYVEQKDYPTALKTIKHLKEQLVNGAGIDIKYTIIGWGKQENLIKKLLYDYNIEKDVRLIYKPDNIEYYYKQADVFLQTSLFEGFSNVVMEAMSFSLPVVATNVGDNNMLIEHGKNGYLSTAGDYKDLAQNLYQLVKNPDQRNNFGKQSFEKINSKYSFQKFQQSYLNLIRSLN